MKSLSLEMISFCDDLSQSYPSFGTEQKMSNKIAVSISFNVYTYSSVWRCMTKVNYLKICII